jgi:predicted NAD/FAD-dependent oxidoreductase
VDPNKVHYVSLAGASSLAKHFLKDANVSFAKAVKGMVLTGECGTEGSSAATAQQWAVTTEDGETTLFDGVVVTAPAPQVLELGGDVQAMLTSAGVRKPLEAVSYSARWALAFEFGADAWSAVNTLDWDARCEHARRLAVQALLECNLSCPFVMEWALLECNLACPSVMEWALLECNLSCICHGVGSA